MNNLTIPPSPNWYQSNIISCSTDNTVAYGSRNEIVVIKPKASEQPADIKIIANAHFDRIISVDIHPYWTTNKLIVSAADDKIVKLWNLETYKVEGHYNTHTVNSDNIVGAVFVGNERIVSISEFGFIVVWRYHTNLITTIKNVFNVKVNISCLSSCPHVSWLMAFGLKCGLVILVDLRRNGSVLYKLRGHDKCVVSLSWCPTPFNIFPRNIANKNIKILNGTKNEGKKTFVSNQSDSDSVTNENMETISAELTSEKQNPFLKIKKPNPWINLKHADDDEIESDPFLQENTPHELISSIDHDFLGECETLKKQILNAVDTTSDISISRQGLPKMDTCQYTNLKDKHMEDTQQKISTTDNDFLSECDNLKRKILNVTDSFMSDTVSNRKSSRSNIEQLIKLDIRNNGSETTSDNADLDIKKYKTSTVKEFNIKASNSKTSVTDDVSDSELDNEIQQIFQPVKEYLLASSARGGSVFIWRAGTDGRMQLELNCSGKSNRKSSKSIEKHWITLCWITPEVLLTSSPTGELLWWDLVKKSASGNVASKKLIHHDHTSNLFAIVAPVHIYKIWEEYSYLHRKDLWAWTVGQDRCILCTSLLSDRKTLASYPTNGGYVYCLSNSPVDPSRLAVGIGDNSAKIWDLSRPHLQCIIMSKLWQKIQSKVFALAWHPKKETLLAYATCEGRIGLITVNNTSKLPVLLRQYFRTSVFQIEWGPINGNCNNIGLYASGEGKLVIYNIDTPSEDPKVFETPSKEYLTQLAWKPDYSYLAVGTKIGSVELYDINLKILTTLYTQSKCVQYLLWHPQATAQDTENSPYALWLAVASSDGSVVILDVSTLSSGDETNSNTITTIAVLNGHTKPVKCLSWSSYEGAKLVSGGEDGIAQVWNVISKTVISTFHGHNVEPIFTAIWSPLDKDFIITGGKDYCIRIWNITENQPMSEDELVDIWKNRARLKFDVHKQQKRNDEESQKIKRVNILNLTTKLQNSLPLKTINECKTMVSMNEKKYKYPDTLHETELGTNLYAGDGISTVKLFGNRNDMISLLEMEQESHKERRKFTENQHISLWKGDILVTLKDAIQQRCVTPWLINMAPMVSPKLWAEACEVYANMLKDEANSDPLEVSSYLLTCHRIEEAIQVLLNGQLFREALALAKCRLSQSDPIINDILLKWAQFNIVNGSYETAAQCFIALEQYEEAAKSLFRRSDPKVLEFAVTLANKSGNKDLLSAIVTRYNSVKSHEGNQNEENTTPLQSRIDAVLSVLTKKQLEIGDLESTDGNNVEIKKPEQVNDLVIETDESNIKDLISNIEKTADLNS